MIKERLKEIDLKITELAEYLDISRPTLYKMIDSYDSGDKDSLSNSIVKLFDFIENHPSAGKKVVIKYLLDNDFGVTNEEDKTNLLIKSLKKYCDKDDKDEIKLRFIKHILVNDEFDEDIHFLAKIKNIKHRKNISEEDKRLLDLYKNIKKKLEKENI